MEEIWRNIKGYEGLYQVSSLGRVRSSHFNKERVLNPSKGSRGYMIVNLCKDNKRKAYAVHRIVAEAFIPNPDGLPQVNHRDENKTNNTVSNLEWCSREYNINYGTGIERRAQAQSMMVYQYMKNGTLVCTYPSVMEAGRRTGYAQTHISNCCNGKIKSAYGYIWSYKLLKHSNILF